MKIDSRPSDLTIEDDAGRSINFELIAGAVDRLEFWAEGLIEDDRQSYGSESAPSIMISLTHKQVPDALLAMQTWLESLG